MKNENKNGQYVYAILDHSVLYNKTHCGIEFEFQPIYIGEGKLSRMFFFSYYNPSRYNKHIYDKVYEIIKRTSKPPLFVKLKGNMSKTESIILERQLIESIGRIYDNSGPLVNKAIGSAGCSGLELTAEHKAKITKQLTGKRRTQEAKNKIAKNNKGIRVMATDLDGNFVGIYPTMSQAARELGVKVSNVHKCCYNIIRRAGQYEFSIVPKERIF